MLYGQYALIHVHEHMIQVKLEMLQFSTCFPKPLGSMNCMKYITYICSPDSLLRSAKGALEEPVLLVTDSLHFAGDNMDTIPTMIGTDLPVEVSIMLQKEDAWKSKVTPNNGETGTCVSTKDVTSEMEETKEEKKTEIPKTQPPEIPEEQEAINFVEIEILQLCHN